MGGEEKEAILKAIEVFKKDKYQFQKIWLSAATDEDIPLHDFMDFEAFIKSKFGCSKKDARKIIEENKKKITN